MEAGLLLDHHRQVVGQFLERRGLRAVWRQSGRTGSSTPARAASSADHGPAATTSRSASRLLRRRALAHLDAELPRAPKQLARDRRRVREPVRPAARRTENVARGEPGDARRIDALDRHAELVLRARAAPRARRGPPRSWRRTGSRPAGRSAGRARRGRRCSRVRARPPAAVENCWRTPPIARAVEPPQSSPRSATTTSSRAEQREVVRDAGADRATAGDDYPGHAATRRSTSARSPSARPRSGARTSGPDRHAARDRARPSRRPGTGTAESAARSAVAATSTSTPGGSRTSGTSRHPGSSRRGPRPLPRRRRRRPGRSTPRLRRRRRGLRGDRARASPTASRRPSSRRGSTPAHAAARSPSAERRSRCAPRTRRRRTAAARRRPRRASKWATSSSSSRAKYGGPITATASAPSSAACAASATVSAVVCAPAVHGDLQPAVAGGDEELGGDAPAVPRARRACPRRSCRGRARRPARDRRGSRRTARRHPGRGRRREAA